MGPQHLLTQLGELVHEAMPQQGGRQCVEARLGRGVGLGLGLPDPTLTLTLTLTPTRTLTLTP